MGFFVSAPRPRAFLFYQESIALYQSHGESVLWAEGFVLSQAVCFVLENERQISSLEMQRFGSVTPKLLI